MADIRKFQTHEVLNKVLNTGEDALKVDIDNVTLTTEGGDVAIDVALDKANDTITVFSNTAKDGSGTSYVPLVDSDGHLQVDTVSAALPSGAATAANQATIIGHVDGIEGLLTTIDTDTGSINTSASSIDGKMTRGENDVAGGGSGLFQVLAYGKDQSGNLDPLNVDNNGHLKITINDIESGISTALPISDNGGSLTVDGTVTANLSATDNAVLDNILVKNTEIDTVLDNIKTDTQAIETDMAAIETLLTAANVDHAANEALLTTIDSDTNNIKTATEASQAALEKMLYGTALAVTAVDGGSDHNLGSTFEAFYIGVGGDISLDLASSGSNIVFKNVASGQLLPIRAATVNASGTTATNIVALKA